VTPALRVDVVSLFPEMIRQAAAHSIVGRAIASGQCALGTVDPRDFTTNRHRTADDYPFGGGAGMVMKPEPLVGAIESVAPEGSGIPVVLLSPDGEPFSQEIARRFAACPHLVLVCGHYEGVDERVREGWVTEEISLGDYVLTGGELAALVVLDATVRLLPGVLGNSESAIDESFGDGLLEYPHYTRPAAFRGRHVPEVLLSGHHAKIADWRRTQSLVRTRSRRPDLWGKIVPLSRRDQRLLAEYDSHIADPLRAGGDCGSQIAQGAATSSVVVSEPVSTPTIRSETTSGGSAEPVTENETKSDSELM